MVLRRASMLPPLGQLRREFDRQFSDLWEGFAQVAPRIVGGRAFPAVNVWEQGDQLLAEVELPGMKSEDLEISVVGSELTIRGERKENHRDEVFHRREREGGSFTRVVRLPAEIDASRVQATLRDGVLSITLPKSEAAKPRKIQVQAAGQPNK